MTKLKKETDRPNSNPGNSLQANTRVFQQSPSASDFIKHWRTISHLCKRSGQTIEVPYFCYSDLFKTPKRREAVKWFQSHGYSFQSFHV